MMFRERFDAGCVQLDPNDMELDEDGRVVRLGDFYEEDPGRRPRFVGGTAIVFDCVPTDEERKAIRKALSAVVDKQAEPVEAPVSRGFTPDWWL